MPVNLRARSILVETIAGLRCIPSALCAAATTLELLRFRMYLPDISRACRDR
jgi:hypothetical protein